MAYTPYASLEDYRVLFPNDEAMTSGQLVQASRHIDSLTFNRITAAGFDNLTEFQKEIIKEVVCRQASFEAENAGLIESVLSSYSINGVSMNFGNNWNVEIQDGIAMHKALYAMLRQTGLCVRQIGG